MMVSSLCYEFAHRLTRSAQVLQALSTASENQDNTIPCLISLLWDIKEEIMKLLAQYPQNNSTTNTNFNRYYTA